MEAPLGGGEELVLEPLHVDANDPIVIGRAQRSDLLQLLLVKQNVVPEDLEGSLAVFDLLPHVRGIDAPVFDHNVPVRGENGLELLGVLKGQRQRVLDLVGQSVVLFVGHQLGDGDADLDVHVLLDEDLELVVGGQAHHGGHDVQKPLENVLSFGLELVHRGLKDELVLRVHQDLDLKERRGLLLHHLLEARRGVAQDVKHPAHRANQHVVQGVANHVVREPDVVEELALLRALGGGDGVGELAVVLHALGLLAHLLLGGGGEKVALHLAPLAKEALLQDLNRGRAAVLHCFHDAAEEVPKGLPRRLPARDLLLVKIVQSVQSRGVDVVQGQVRELVAKVSDFEQRLLENWVENVQVSLQHLLAVPCLLVPHALLPGRKALPQLVLPEDVQRDDLVVQVVLALPLVQGSELGLAVNEVGHAGRAHGVKVILVNVRVIHDLEVVGVVSERIRLQRGEVDELERVVVLPEHVQKGVPRSDLLAFSARHAHGLARLLRGLVGGGRRFVLRLDFDGVRQGLALLEGLLRRRRGAPCALGRRPQLGLLRGLEDGQKVPSLSRGGPWLPAESSRLEAPRFGGLVHRHVQPALEGVPRPPVLGAALSVLNHRGGALTPLSRLLLVSN